MIRACQVEDAGGICSIYNHYVQNTIIPFEEQLVSEAEMRRVPDSFAGFLYPVLLAAKAACTQECYSAFDGSNPLDFKTKGKRSESG